jgi:hypothetical protein
MRDPVERLLYAALALLTVLSMVSYVVSSQNSERLSELTKQRSQDSKRNQEQIKRQIEEMKRQHDQQDAQIRCIVTLFIESEKTQRPVKVTDLSKCEFSHSELDGSTSSATPNSAITPNPPPSSGGSPSRASQSVPNSGNSGGSGGGTQPAPDPLLQVGPISVPRCLPIVGCV